MYKYILPLLCCVLSVFSGFTQKQIKNKGRFFINNFTPENYKAHSQNWCIAQDSAGRMYFGNSNGLLVFNGENWNLYPMPNTSIVRSVFLSGNRIYVGAQNEFGFFEPNKTGDLVYKSLTNLLKNEEKQFNDIWSIKNDGDEIIFLSLKYIFVYNNKDIISFKPFRSYSGFLLDFGNKIFVTETEKGLINYSKRNVTMALNGERFIGDRINSVIRYSDTLFLAASRKNGLLLFNDRFLQSFNNETADYLSKNSIYSMIDLPNNQIAVATLNGGVVLLDKNGKLIQIINKTNGLIDDNVYNMFVDREGNLWTANENGISCIEINSPITFYKDEDGITSLPFALFADKNNFFVSVTSGILRKNWTEKPDSLSIKKINLYAKDENRIWDIKKFGNNLFFAGKDVIIITDEKNRKEIISFENIIWQIDTIKGMTGRYLLFCNDGLYTLEKTTQWQIKKFNTTLNINCRYSTFDSEGNIWITENNKAITKLTPDFKNNTLNNIKNYQNLPDSEQLSDLRIIELNKRIYLCANSKIFIYNKTTDNFERFNNIKNNVFDPNINFLFRVKDITGCIWGQKNGKPVFITSKTDSLHILQTPFLRLPSVNLYLTMMADSVNAFFGYPKILFHFDRSFVKDYNQPFQTIIQKISFINSDSVLFYSFIDFNKQNKQTIYYNHNSLRFDFSSCFYQDVSENQYSYFLEGYDKTWSDWTDISFKEYTNLPQGDYIFKIKSKNVFGVTSNTASFLFKIPPPWYKSTLAYLIYIILFITGVIVIVRLKTRNLKKANEKLERIVKERTAEIMAQKEELEVQAEQLALTNQELAKLSVIAEKTDNAVAVFDKDAKIEWVNAGFERLYGYTLPEIINQFGNNLCSISANKDIENILNSLNTEKKGIVYEAQNKSKNGDMLWVQTTITPILDEQNNLKKIFTLDTDITNIKKAEAEIIQRNYEILAQRDEILEKSKHIEEQNDSIKSSIGYAKTIQQAILPEIDFIKQYFEIFIIYKPKDIVSGDFYWFNSIPDVQNQVLKLNNNSQIADYCIQSPTIEIVIVADCTGHGVPGAFMSLIGNRLFGEIITENKIYLPSKILFTLNELIKKALKQDVSDNNDGMDVVLCLISKKQNGADIIFAGCKRPLYIYNPENKTLQKIKGDSVSIGGFHTRKACSFNDQLLHANKNDILYMASDGFIDQNNSLRRRFGSVKFEELICNTGNLSLTEQKVIFEKELTDYMLDNEQRDDITVIALKIG